MSTAEIERPARPAEFTELGGCSNEELKALAGQWGGLNSLGAERSLITALTSANERGGLAIAMESQYATVGLMVLEEDASRNIDGMNVVYFGVDEDYSQRVGDMGLSFGFSQLLRQVVAERNAGIIVAHRAGGGRGEESLMFFEGIGFKLGPVNGWLSFEAE